MKDLRDLKEWTIHEDNRQPFSVWCEAFGELGQDERASGRRWSHCSGSTASGLKKEEKRSGT